MYLRKRLGIFFGATLALCVGISPGATSAAQSSTPGVAILLVGGLYGQGIPPQLLLRPPGAQRFDQYPKSKLVYVASRAYPVNPGIDTMLTKVFEDTRSRGHATRLFVLQDGPQELWNEYSRSAKDEFLRDAGVIPFGFGQSIQSSISSILNSNKGRFILIGDPEILSDDLRTTLKQLNFGPERFSFVRIDRALSSPEMLEAIIENNRAWLTRERLINQIQEEKEGFVDAAFPQSSRRDLDAWLLSHPNFDWRDIGLTYRSLGAGMRPEDIPKFYHYPIDGESFSSLAGILWPPSTEQFPTAIRTDHHPDETESTEEIKTTELRKTAVFFLEGGFFHEGETEPCPYALQLLSRLQELRKANPITRRIVLVNNGTGANLQVLNKFLEWNTFTSIVRESEINARESVKRFGKSGSFLLIGEPKRVHEFGKFEVALGNHIGLIPGATFRIADLHNPADRNALNHIENAFQPGPDWKPWRKFLDSMETPPAAKGREPTPGIGMKRSAIPPNATKVSWNDLEEWERNVGLRSGRVLRVDDPDTLGGLDGMTLKNPDVAGQSDIYLSNADDVYVKTVIQETVRQSINQWMDFIRKGELLDPRHKDYLVTAAAVDLVVNTIRERTEALLFHCRRGRSFKEPASST